jgi:hypothetical protein
VVADLVPTEDIERIVGATRHRWFHQARAVSAEQTVYVLHSQKCLDSGIDLRECPYSLALDHGIRVEEWRQDEPVMVHIEGDYGKERLVPCAHGA